MSQPPDILVHISAPSRLSDDARYRQQFRSLLQFQPTRKYTLSIFQEKGQGDSPAGGLEEKSRNLRKTPRPDDQRDGADQLEHAESPPQVLRSFTSLLPTSSSHNSDQTSTSHVPETTFKAPANIHITRTPFPPPKSHNISRPHGSSGGIQETPLPQLPATSSWTTPPSVIPDSQPTPANAKRRLDSSSPSPTHDSSSPTSKRQRCVRPSRPLPPPVRLSSPLPPLTSPPRAPASSPTLFRPSSLTISPPPPSISMQKFKTHLTPDLIALAAKTQLVGYYTSQVSLQTRPLGVHEIGYWVVPLESLNEKEKDTLWDFLGRFMGKGKAGWFVCCVLEGISSPPFTGLDESEGTFWTSDDLRGEQEEESVLKVRCWGEVVGEVWNVLFLGTGKKVRGSGARWVTLREEVREGKRKVVDEVVVWMK